MSKLEIIDMNMGDSPYIVIKNDETKTVAMVDYGWSDSTIWNYVWLVNLFKFAGIESEVTESTNLDIFQKLLSEGYEGFDYRSGKPEQ